MLSSFLNIPYSVGRGSANVNAGAIFAFYLVFDELHLLDPDRSIRNGSQGIGTDKRYCSFFIRPPA
jgi:hypothetical protein